MSGGDFIFPAENASFTLKQQNVRILKDNACFDQEIPLSPEHMPSQLNELLMVSQDDAGPEQDSISLSRRLQSSQAKDSILQPTTDSEFEQRR